MGARHAACAWGGYAWPDAGDGGFRGSFTSQQLAHERLIATPRGAHRRQTQLDQYAWRNRRAPTESEARLWQLLRARKLGVWFRRQVPLGGRYIADFVAPGARLVVEVDGSSHAGREHGDARRDRTLERLGYRVLRLPAELVMRAPNTALALVAQALRR